VELVTGAILVSYLYWLRGKMSEIRSRIRNSQSLSTLTAADFTVMVSDVPEGWAPVDIRSFFERFGEVRFPAFANAARVADTSRPLPPFPLHCASHCHALLWLASAPLKNHPVACTRLLVIPIPNEEAFHLSSFCPYLFFTSHGP
jgi:hypothetical protein